MQFNLNDLENYKERLGYYIFARIDVKKNYKILIGHSKNYINVTN